jgi:hypothetical protein
LTFAGLDTGGAALRFTAGADAVNGFEEQLASKRAELDRWRALSVSLTFRRLNHPTKEPRG